MKMFTMLIAALALCAAPLAAEDAAMQDLGPSVGAVIPHDLSAHAHDGAMQSFETLAGDKGLALFFVRSVDWCPYCQAQVIDVSGRISDFEDRDLKVVFVSYDPPETQQAFIDRKANAAFMLSDPESEIIDAFGLRNENYEEGSRAYGVPHPAVFIVNGEREIAAKLYEEDYRANEKSYRERPPVDTILEAVDEAIAAGRL